MADGDLLPCTTTVEIIIGEEHICHQKQNTLREDESWEEYQVKVGDDVV